MIASRFAAAAALSLAFSAPTAAQAPRQTILVWNFGFAPRPISLAAGRPVTLTFQNRSGHNHDFTAREFFAYSRILAGAAPGGEIDLGPYQTKSITLVPRAGTYPAHCSHFLHAQLGMTDVIYVY
jgi:plastocyanin